MTACVQTQPRTKSWKRQSYMGRTKYFLYAVNMRLRQIR